jgi:hypothetical protein
MYLILQWKLSFDLILKWMGARSCELGAGSRKLRVESLEPGAWSLEPGAWSLELGDAGFEFLGGDLGVRKYTFFLRTRGGLMTANVFDFKWVAAS